MSDDRYKRESMSIKEATISNMCEIATIVKVHVRKSVLAARNRREVDVVCRR